MLPIPRAVNISPYCADPRRKIAAGKTTRSGLIMPSASEATAITRKRMVMKRSFTTKLSPSNQSCQYAIHFDAALGRVVSTCSRVMFAEFDGTRTSRIISAEKK